MNIKTIVLSGLLLIGMSASMANTPQHMRAQSL